MAVTTSRLTFQEYLNDDDLTSNGYELVDGALVAMGIRTGLHGEIARFLNVQLS